MKITDNDFQNVIAPLLIDLLSDPGFLQTDPDANEAVEKIRNVGLFTCCAHPLTIVTVATRVNRANLILPD